LKTLSNAVVAGAIAAMAAASLASVAAAAEAGSAKSQAAAARATGKPTTDTPAASQPQGTAWAVRQAAGQPAAQPAPATAPIAKVAPKGDLVATLQASGQFKTLLKATDAANLTGVLRTNRNLTLFAPTDAAFAALPPGELDRLMADPAGLQKLLSHHIFNARVESSAIKDRRWPVPSVAGDPIELDGTGATLKADGADIVQPDVLAANGVLHVVDRVLTPSGATPPAAAPH